MKCNLVQTDWSNNRPSKLVFLSSWLICVSINDFKRLKSSGDVSANQPPANSHLGLVVDFVRNNV